MQNYENFCVYANEFSSAAVWGNLTRISTDGMCDFLRISTDLFLAAVGDYLCNLCEILGVGV